MGEIAKREGDTGELGKNTNKTSGSFEMNCRFLALAAASTLGFGAVAAPIKLDPARCPVRPPPQLASGKLPTGEFLLTARFLLRADGGIEQITIDGNGPESFRRAIAAAIRRYECLPAEGDQEIESEFRIKIS